MYFIFHSLLSFAETTLRTKHQHQATRSGLTQRHFKIFEHYSSDRNMNEVFATNANIQRDRKNTSLSPVL